ncbi:MAG: 2-C-methyl-D-erythritol 2,4-cyclodiphosphate synthase [Clostridiales bacterium]|nr:2-C-methyl-D-erythritol 2,4-cyclodiphosphate synthase [Clostridiales bacterium]
MISAALILCGGSGTRMGAKGNKTLLQVDDVPAVVKCFQAFSGLVNEIVLVTRAGEEDLFSAALAQYGLAADKIVPGGADRQASALCGLRALSPDCQAVLIHDGARPFVKKETIQNVLAGIEKNGSGVAAVPARDTIKKTDDTGLVLETPDRATLWHAQTPQGFWLKDLLAAHEKAAQRYTDDAALMEAAGYPVHLVMGGYDNIKLTSPEDLRMNASLLPRMGTGYDAHRLVENRDLWLCGVKIPHEKGLLGHSDADVALHALMDALLGAAALGDIGKLFPDSAEKYKGISSMLLLEEVVRVLSEKEFVIGNVDVTIIAQAPKLAPYMDEMRATVAKGLKIPLDRVSVKATTTEKMGFEGRKEGISAQAAAVLFHQG